MSVTKKVKFSDESLEPKKNGSEDNPDNEEEWDDEEDMESEDGDENEDEEEDDDDDDDDNVNDDDEDEDEIEEADDKTEEEPIGLEFEGDAINEPEKKGQASDRQTFENPEVQADEGDPVEDPDKKKRVRATIFKNAKNRSKRLIIVLEKANLEIVKVGKDFELLNTDEHMSLIRKYKKDPAFCRPDITHQCLLMLFDSPLNRAGLLQVYIKTMNNVLIEINPQTRFPRTFKRFANLMVQLLYKMSIKSSQGPEKLLRVVKNPVTGHLPVGCRKIGTSFKGEKLISPSELIPDPTSEEPIAIVIGAMAHGEATVDYTEETVSISNYPLSAALACTKIVSAFEQAWGVL